MKSSDSRLTYNPFGGLKSLLGKKSPEALPPETHERVFDEKNAPDPQEEKKMFLLAMRDVTPITREITEEISIVTPHPEQIKRDPEAEVLMQLEKLVHHGNGLIIADTQEYIEGTGDNVHPEFARKLHRGDFSIQAHIDLHGFSVEEARTAVHKFLKSAVSTGKRAVLIIHGRGLSSPGEPVLKNKVREWLTSGYWRKWVMAFASARSYDGGTGATYILLRHRPLSNRRGRKFSHT